MTEETWGQVREELLRAVGKNNFSAWIDPISFDRMEGRTARFHVPTTFFGSWVSQNYGDVIRRTLASAGVGADRVEFNVGPAEARHVANAASAQDETPHGAELEAAVAAAPVLARSAAANPVAGVVADIRRPAQLHFRELRRRQAERAWPMPPRAAWPKGGDGHVQPAVPLRRRGLGKTHLMHAIAWELQANFPDAEGPVSLGRAVHVPLRARAALARHDRLQADVPLRRRADGR
jgi:chromosomal replication initiator protein